MTDKTLKRILLTTGYTTQTDKDAVYLYIKQLQEVIEEVRALHKKFCTKHGIIVFENNELIEFMNNLIDTLNKAKDNK